MFFLLIKFLYRLGYICIARVLNDIRDTTSGKVFVRVLNNHKWNRLVDTMNRLTDIVYHNAVVIESSNIIYLKREKDRTPVFLVIQCCTKARH